MSLQYRTNGPEFDFPPFAGLPPVRYVLASTPRCGSNMLARALWRTGRAGFAEDYLADAHVLDFFERWGFTSGDPAASVEGLLRRLMRFRTSPNGVFGIRVHSRHLPSLEVDLHEALRSPRYIRIQRRDRLRQAISYVLADQTGIWILDGTHLPEPGAGSTPRYSYREIRRRLRLLDREETLWTAYFRRRGLVPHVVGYEDLCSDYEESVLGCLRFLGVSAPEQIPRPGIRRQADETTDQWVERFERDDAARRRAAAGGTP